MKVLWVVSLSIASLACVSALRLRRSPPYFEQYLDQQVDHFNYEDTSTYKERYLVSGEYSRHIIIWRGWS